MVTDQEIQTFKEKLHRTDEYSHEDTLPYDLHLSEDRAIEIGLICHELFDEYDNFSDMYKKVIELSNTYGELCFFIHSIQVIHNKNGIK